MSDKKLKSPALTQGAAVQPPMDTESDKVAASDRSALALSKAQKSQVILPATTGFVFPLLAHQITGGDIVAHVIEIKDDLTAEQMHRFSLLLHGKLSQRQWVSDKSLCIYTYIRHGPKAVKNVCIAMDSVADRLSGIMQNQFETNKVVYELLGRTEGKPVRSFLLALAADDPPKDELTGTVVGPQKGELTISAFLGPTKISHLRAYIPRSVPVPEDE